MSDIEEELRKRYDEIRDLYHESRDEIERLRQRVGDVQDKLSIALSANHDLRDQRDDLIDRVAACDPFLKDGETPAECIARNRRDVDGCLTLLVKEKRETEALRQRCAELEQTLWSRERDIEAKEVRVAECEKVMLHYGMETETSCMCAFDNDTGKLVGECGYHEAISARLAAAEALLLAWVRPWERFPDSDLEPEGDVMRTRAFLAGTGNKT